MFEIGIALLLSTGATLQRNVLCLDDRFVESTEAFASATPIPGASVVRADDACLDAGIEKCAQRTPLDASKTWIAGARVGEWVCVTDGQLYGWIESAKVTLSPPPAPPKNAWLGTWEFAYSGGDPTIRIRQRRDGKLHVSGYAEWRSHPDSVPNLGELDFTGLPHGIVFDDGDPACFEQKWADDEPKRCFDCIIRLVLVNDQLLARDNGRCGGMNVSFSTMYKRK